MKIPSPMPSLSSLSSGPPTRHHWYRAVRLRFATKATALATGHTRIIPGRYNGGTLKNKSFPVLYLAETPIVALFEVQALVGSPIMVSGIHPMPGAGAWTILTVRVNLTDVADLTYIPPPASPPAQPDLQTTTFKTNAQELTGDWRAYGYRAPGKTSVEEPSSYPAPTQRLGAALHAVHGLEGFETISARVPHQRILVVFPDKLYAEGKVEFINEDGERWDIKDIKEIAEDT